MMDNERANERINLPVVVLLINISLISRGFSITTLDLSHYEAVKRVFLGYITLTRINGQSLEMSSL